MDPRRIHEYDLCVRKIDDPLDTVTRRLRFVGHSGDLFPNEAIEERRFARIWAADERDVSASKPIFRH